MNDAAFAVPDLNLTLPEGTAQARRARYCEYVATDLPWLGSIPCHWKLKRLKYCAFVLSGGTPSMGVPEYWNGEIPWVSPKDMYTWSIVDTQDHITDAGLAESSSRLIQPGALLMVVRSGILQHSIPVAINAVPVSINQDIRAIVPKGILLADYLAYLITGHQKALLLEWGKQGATVQSIETFQLRMALPGWW